MARTVIRHTLSALAAAALLAAFANSNAYPSGRDDGWANSVKIREPVEYPGAADTPKGLIAPKGPTAEKPSVQPNSLMGVFVQPETVSPSP